MHDLSQFCTILRGIFKFDELRALLNLIGKSADALADA